MKRIHLLIRNYKKELIVVFVSLLFSSWLMIHTFSYASGSMLIAAKAWSDFANHIPLIRSFSLGWNFPPTDPLFSGEHIHYHFLFYLLVGFLERIGFRIDWALNIPSISGFAALLVMLYIFAKKVFDSSMVGILTIIFFLFDGSLSFINFFDKHHLSRATITDIITNNTFPSFGPYDHGIVSAFWNLNIYTNQRHLAPAYALSLGIILAFLFHLFKNSRPNIRFSILMGILLGLSFFFHMAVFIMTVVVLLGFLLFYPTLRFPILTTLSFAGVLAAPEYLYLKSGNHGTGFGMIFAPGYLIHNNLTLENFVEYWFMNLGLHSILMFIGFFKAPGNIRKIFLSILPIFIIGNLFQFSPEMAANHKFFNFVMLFGVMLSSYALVLTWKKNTFAKPIVITITFLLVLSGIIDFFPVYNDHYLTLADYPSNTDIEWIMKNTPTNSQFFTTNYLYDTANIAGRSIFLGWPYFPWSSGYDTTTRTKETNAMLASNNKTTVCLFMKRHTLSYITITNPSPDFQFDPTFFKNNFTPAYQGSGLTIYATHENCL